VKYFASRSRQSALRKIQRVRNASNVATICLVRSPAYENCDLAFLGFAQSLYEA